MVEGWGDLIGKSNSKYGPKYTDTDINVAFFENIWRVLSVIERSNKDFIEGFGGLTAAGSAALFLRVR